MSLITRCPACGTMFKVVPDQLRISEGWVRCGHCSEVFDAAAHLQNDEAVLAQAQPDVQPAARTGEPGESTNGFSSSIHTQVGEDEGYQIPAPAELEAQARAMQEDPLDRPFELRRSDLSPLEQVPDVAPTPTPEPELHDLSFVRKARRQAFWASRGVRIALAATAVLLTLLLLGQYAVYDRDRLAAAEPSLRPWLVRLCEPLRCTLRAPRQIDAITIDSSAFSKLRGDAYRLSVTLKNQSPIDVAMPALELTLTDAQDQPVVRRVLMPAEIAPATGVVAGGGDWSASVALAVNPSNGASRIAGYRVLAFYP